MRSPPTSGTELSPEQYYSHGKLLVSGEYVVLRGALALALPLRFGQSLAVAVQDSGRAVLYWRSFAQGQHWFQADYALDDLSLLHSTDRPKAARLRQVLLAAQKLNPAFLKTNSAVHVETNLEFAPCWGWGSSSTLVHNVAQWARIDPFALSHDSWGGSGYDVACARAPGPIYYQILKGKSVAVPAPFKPAFHEQIFFVYLGQKQDSEAARQKFSEVVLEDREIEEISQLSRAMVAAKTFPEFTDCLVRHEARMGEILHEECVQKKRFPDFPGTMKSLGAWGGDFVLAACADAQAEQTVFDYFNARGMKSVFSFRDIVLES